MKFKSVLSAALLLSVVTLGSTINTNKSVAAPAWQARHGLSSAQYQKTFDKLTNQGYRLRQVSCYPQQGKAKYAAIWEKTSGPAWRAVHGILDSQFQAVFNQYKQQGYRLVERDVCTVNGRVLHTAIFERSSSVAWQVRKGMSSKEYQQKFDQLTQQGYRLRDVSCYNRQGKARYAAIWDKSSGPTWRAVHGLTAQKFQQIFNQYTQQGYRLVHRDICNVNGQTLRAAIFEKGGQGAWQAHSGLTSSQYQVKFDNLVSKGFKLAEVEGYPDKNGSTRYGAIWVKN